MLDPSLETTYELHMFKGNLWKCWMQDLTFDQVKEQQQAWKHINREIRIVEVTRRVL